MAVIGDLVRGHLGGGMRVLARIDHVSRWAGRLAAGSIFLLGLAVVYATFAAGGAAADAGHMLYATAFLSAGAYALSRNGHVRADILYRLWPPRTQAALDLVFHLLLLLPASVALVWSGYSFAGVAWRAAGGEASGDLPHHLRLLVPLGALLLLLQALAEAARCVRCLRAGLWPPRPNDVEDLEGQVLEQVRRREGRLGAFPSRAARSMTLD